MRLKKTFTREEVAALLDGIDTMRDIERALRAAGYGKGVAAKVASRFFVRPDDDSEALSAPIVGDGVQARPDDIQTQVDLARAQLICDLQDDLGVNDEGVEVILDLLDQLYGLRQAVRDMLDNMIAEAKK